MPFIVRSVLLLACTLPLQGCATLSFTPPAVPLNSYPNPTIENALADVDGFIRAYRTAAGDAANGRSKFEVPAFLTTVGALTATAFGAGPGVAIASSAAGATLNGGNSYFAPKSKASILRTGITAFGAAVGMEVLESSAGDSLVEDAAKLTKMQTDLQLCVLQARN